MKSVTSADGTLIVYERGGSGPPLVLVHTTGNRATFGLMRPTLEEHLTVVTMDRRGRGDSGDGPEYSLEREFEDVLAVVDALDAPCLLFGHSFGAVCALGAALRTDRLAGLILYEPWMVLEEEPHLSPAQLERFERLLAADDREGILRLLLVEIVGLPVNVMEEIIAAPTWDNSLAAAPTVPREMRALDTYRLPAEQAGRLSTPVLLLLGGDSPPFAGRLNTRLEKALPNTRTVVMAGQQHIADATGPDVLAGAVLDFWRDIA